MFDKKTKQIKHTNKFLKPIEIKLNGKSLIVKLFYGTYFGFLLSYFLAEIEKVDYKLMPKIDYLKGNKN